MVILICISGQLNASVFIFVECLTCTQPATVYWPVCVNLACQLSLQLISLSLPATRFRTANCCCTRCCAHWCIVSWGLVFFSSLTVVLCYKYDYPLHSILLFHDSILTVPAKHTAAVPCCTHIGLPLDTLHCFLPNDLLFHAASVPCSNTHAERISHSGSKL